MDDYDPYDPNDYSQAELVEMAMGNPAGENRIAMDETAFHLTKAQGSLISEALSAFDGYETDVEQEVAQQTERVIRERFDLD